MPDKEFETPMMMQYVDIKQKYPDCILFFRLGDFYEMFMDDAKVGSEVLDITLTARDRGKDGKIPMCGIPYHAADAYISKLVREGYKVAVCEQLTQPNGAGLVERDVVRIITPGTILDESSLERKENNYIMGVHLEGSSLGLAFADLSTGAFFTKQSDVSEMSAVLIDCISKFFPSECILSDEIYNNPEVLKILKIQRNLNIFPYSDWERFAGFAKDFLTSHFGIVRLASFGIEEMFGAQKACAGLLGYLKYTQKDKLNHIRNLTLLTENKHMYMDRSTISNLELVKSIKEGERKGTLLNHMDLTNTSMGARMLRQWLLEPLYDEASISHRLDGVEELLEKQELRFDLISRLKEINDIERILSRLAVGIGNPKDLISLKNSVAISESVKNLSIQFYCSSLRSIGQSINEDFLSIYDEISKTINDEPPFDPKNGGVIKDGVDEELDKLRRRVKGSKDFISRLEKKERERTGISSLKVKFNQVFGYYIEITNSNLSMVPSNYMRKQTLVNAERFITPELKEHEEIILSAEEKINELEYNRFLQLTNSILDKTDDIQTAATSIANLDCLVSLAQLADENSYSKPKITHSGKIIIKEGRHPVVEESIGHMNFISNDTLLDQNCHQLLILTGPNMAGKSVYIRQVSLIVLMAQMGSYVPASFAEISLTDKLFVRSGAADAISMGLSTFMVEMVETANILNNATKDSLIVMDEIGRGTSTYDGISIAWSVAEYLVSKKSGKPKTLFATHYHELQKLEEKYPNQIKNFQIIVDENSGEPVFLHKLKEGGAGHSFGIAVAKLAGVPEVVCTRATEILNDLKSRGAQVSPDEKCEVTTSSKDIAAISDSHFSERLEQIDISRTTPLEALNMLAELKDILSKS
jgi:DNA mismatch repair protein MutS